MTFRSFLQTKLAGWIVVILVFSIIFFIQKWQGERFHKRISDNPGITNGYVEDVKYYLKSGWRIHYSFSANNEIFRGGNFSKHYETLRSIIINRSFPVIYNQKDPGDNAMLITPEDFQAFNVPFPDSLYWIKNRLDK